MPAINVTTANVCGNPMRPKWAVRRRMDQAISIAGVVFGQEIARSNRWRRGNYSSMWRSVAWDHNKRTYGSPREVPISLNTDVWKVLGTSSVMVHGGRKRVSPARYITVVEARRHTGELVAFVNCHTVSKPRRGVSASRWRMDRHRLYMSKLGRIVARLHEAGYTVVFGGDMNHRRPRKVHPDQLTLVSSGLDHLWVLPGPDATVRIRKPRKRRRTALMDHPILTGRFYLHDND